MITKRGQLPLYIIIALVILAIVIAIFIFSGYNPLATPSTLTPVFTAYSSCIETQTRLGIDLAESQGGRITVGPYNPGSNYAPFSSQLNFLGLTIPYWYYIAGNGLTREQLPVKSTLEHELADYIASGVQQCDFSILSGQGFNATFGKPKVTVQIQDLNVVVDVAAAVVGTHADQTERKDNHHVEVASKLGRFLTVALGIYAKEKSEAFLENYSVDVLKLYAPVDGVDLSCSPKVWKTNDVVSDLKSALSANIAAIKFQGDYYSLSNPVDKYFVVKYPIDSGMNAQMQYLADWPSKFEIAGGDGALLITKPIGTQPGLGVMGFCYAPYHFVYDMSFPVMIQLFDDQELFQFPVAVVISKNMPREGIPSTMVEDTTSDDVCSVATQPISVHVYDTNLKPLQADVSYTCFEQECALGSTTGGVLEGQAPACLNGYINAKADGFATKKQLFSSNKEQSVDIILDKLYTVNLSVVALGKPVLGNSIISFTNGETSFSSFLPDSPSMTLPEGQYNITVYVYGNSSVVVPASTKTQCSQVPSGGIFGMLGSTQEQCYDITIPATTIDHALIGGGNGFAYLLPAQLSTGNLTLDVPLFAPPTSLDQLQNNFASFDSSTVDVELAP